VELLGAIEPGDHPATGKPQWAELINAHPQLSSGPAKAGINPFTKRPMEFKPSPYHGSVEIAGRKVGAIHWAMDDSRRLIVWSDAGSETPVRAVAEDVASRLGWHFVSGGAI
jgi:hypothetical protein